MSTSVHKANYVPTASSPPGLWAARGQPSNVADTLVNHRAGRVITIESADAFFERLESLVSAQADAQRPNPRSVELMVASAKKFLARPEFRIQLDELIGGELRRIDQGVVTSVTHPGGAWSNDYFISTVARYEAQTEVLARIFGVMGRYGTGEEFRDVLDAIVKLSFRDPVGGFNFLTNIRTYPAVLLFYAYGIGLLKAQRFADLFKLFSTPINTGRDQTQTAASYLLVTRWEGTENDPGSYCPDWTSVEPPSAIICTSYLRGGPSTTCLRRANTPPCSSILSCWERSPTSPFQTTKPLCKQRFKAGISSLLR
jgi:hypothetical protein